MTVGDAPTSGAVIDATDQSLLSRFRRGSDDAATAIYFRYAHRLKALAHRQCGSELSARVDADDIVQSVFRTFFRRAARGEYEVPAGEELWRLLLVIALHKIRGVAAHHRAAKRDVGATIGGGSHDLANIPDGDEAASAAVLKLAIDEALQSLPAEQRPIIELRIAGEEVAEIARRTGRAKRSVERVLQAFRHSLAAAIEG